MSNDNTLLPIQQLESRFRSVATRLPAIAGNVAVNFALDNFKRQGFLGDTIQPWRPRKDPNKWKQSPKRNSRAILVDTGTLRRSIRIISTTFDEVIVGSDVPYAQAHNEGFKGEVTQNVKSFTRKVNTVATMGSKGKKPIKVQTGSQTVKAFTRKIKQNIPARPFLADSQYLQAQLQRTIGAEILRALRN